MSRIIENGRKAWADLVECERAFILEDSAGTLEHSRVRPLRGRLHSLRDNE